MLLSVTKAGENGMTFRVKSAELVIHCQFSLSEGEVQVG